MKRELFEKLIKWKNSPGRKPLIIRGARQVGKTWLMKEFGRTNYDQTIYLNFEKNKRLGNLFTDGFEIKRVITALQAESGFTINPENTLLIFDEIQSVPEAITSLKYFYEDGPQYHIIAAGSLLGMAIHSNVSFPVGKVAFMDLHPLTYPEFLDALNENPLIEILQTCDWRLITAYKSGYIERLRQYYYVGGMPEAVLRFSENNNFREVRDIQKQILESYEHDFSKHAPAAIVPRIRMLWNSIPSQLAKENRKFIYGLVREGSRAKDYELALSWLIDCGQVSQVCRVTKPGIPLKAYEDRGAFKLFMVDIGLLSAMTDIDSKTLLEGNSIFTEFKGSLTEQYVFQQIISAGKFPVYYWSSERSTAEVDFVIQHENNFIPVEVKAEENLKAKSLKVFTDKFAPALSVRTSMSDFRIKDQFMNLPLYAISIIEKALGQGAESGEQGAGRTTA
ncbi:MAG: ATP-binding protein [Bacteroidales bacterium]